MPLKENCTQKIITKSMYIVLYTPDMSANIILKYILD